MNVKHTNHAILPTYLGNFFIIGFQEIYKNVNHIILSHGNINYKKPILVRIHSECFTGDCLFSLKCDCGLQLQTALINIINYGNGILIYHKQEGRDIGLLNKIQAYNLQNHGLDTVESNHKLGFADDERNFFISSKILKSLNIYRIKLLTNNPFKMHMLCNYGIKIIARKSLLTKNNFENSKYLHTKIKKMGHLIS